MSDLVETATKRLELPNGRSVKHHNNQITRAPSNQRADEVEARRNRRTRYSIMVATPTIAICSMNILWLDNAPAIIGLIAATLYGLTALINVYALVAGPDDVRKPSDYFADYLIDQLMFAAPASIAISGLVLGEFASSAIALTATMWMTMAVMILYGVKFVEDRRKNVIRTAVVGAIYCIGFFSASITFSGIVGILWTTAAALLVHQTTKTRGELYDLSVETGHLAQIDSLTAVLNREGLMQQLKDSDEPHTISLIDVDRFRVINERHGHTFGDAVLKEIAKRITRLAGEDAVVARMSSDRFAILKPGSIKDIKTRDFLHQLIYDLAQVLHIEGRDIHLTYRSGTTVVHNNQGLAEAIEQASFATRAAKRQDREQIVFMDDYLQKRWQSEQAIESRVSEAFENNEFEFWLQPIVLAYTKSAMAVELLCRWPQPDGTVIPPNKFLPVLRDVGLLPEIGRLALKFTGELLREWRNDPDLGHLNINVNVDPAHAASTLAEDLIELIDPVDLPRVAVELVESEMVTEPEKVAVNLSLIRKQGTHVVIDDFGAGYSALMVLAELPVSAVKVDRSLVRHIERNEKQQQLTSAIKNVCVSLDLILVAEGVETERELKELQDQGYFLIQGWIFARAEPLEKAVLTLRRLRSEALVESEEDVMVAEATALDLQRNRFFKNEGDLTSPTAPSRIWTSN